MRYRTLAVIVAVLYGKETGVALERPAERLFEKIAVVEAPVGVLTGLHWSTTLEYNIVTFSNDTPNPTSGCLPGDRSSQAFAALYALRVLPDMIRRLGCMALNAESAESPDAGARLVWLEAAIGAIADYQEEHVALLRQTPLDRTCRN